jgi:hypothetical protein
MPGESPYTAGVHVLASVHVERLHDSCRHA